MTKVCTVVNFHNLHSLLGQFGSLVFEQTESSNQCWFVVKKQLFQRDTKGKLKTSRRRKGHFVALYQVVTDPCCGYLLRVHLASDWSRNNKHSRNFLWCSRFYGNDCNLHFRVNSLFYYQAFSLLDDLITSERTMWQHTHV